MSHIYTYDRAQNILNFVQPLQNLYFKETFDATKVLFYTLNVALEKFYKVMHARVNRSFPVNATLICFIVVKQSCMINTVVRKINISHFKDSASHRKLA